MINAASDFQLFLTQRTTLNTSLETSHDDNMLVSLARVKDKIEVVQLNVFSSVDTPSFRGGGGVTTNSLKFRYFLKNS